MKNRAAIVQFIAGAVLVALIGLMALLWLRPRPDAPPGWQVIRPPGDVLSLAEYGDAIWSAGADGVVKIDPASGVVLETTFTDAAALLADSHTHLLYAGHREGLSRYDGLTWQPETLPSGLAETQVLALGRGLDGALWLATPAGIARRLEGRWQVFTREDGLASDAASVIFTDSQSRVWLGDGFSTTGGLSMFDGAMWHNYTPEDGLAHQMVNDIIEVPDGVLWFGCGFSSQGGATRYDGDTWTTLTQADGLAGGKVRSLMPDDRGGLWFGSEYDGIAIFANDHWRVITPDDGLAGWETKAMLLDSQGTLWLGSENGITRLSRRAWEALLPGS